MNEEFMSNLDSGAIVTINNRSRSGQTKGFFVNIMMRTLDAKKCTELAEH